MLVFPFVCAVPTQGADNIMEDRASDFSLVGGRPLLDEQLEVFAAQGLRTLVLAMKRLDEKFVASWLDDWKAAEADMDDRYGMMAKVAATLEIDITVIGATAIEDRLQVSHFLPTHHPRRSK